MRGERVILCVDGDVVLRQVVQGLQQVLGCNVLCFGSAEELLSSRLFGHWSKVLSNNTDGVCEKEIACLVCEFRLPGMDGLQLLQWLRDRHLLIPSVFVTACGDWSTAAALLRQGALEVLTKPVLHEQLLEALECGIRFSPLLRRFERSCQRQLEQLGRLTDRERDVFARVLCRMPLKQIAVELGTSPHTVRNQRQSILQKLEAADDADLLLIAMSVRMHRQGLHWPLLSILAGDALLP